MGQSILGRVESQNGVGYLMEIGLKFLGRWDERLKLFRKCRRKDDKIIGLEGRHQAGAHIDTKGLIFRGFSLRFEINHIEGIGRIQGMMLTRELQCLVLLKTVPIFLVESPQI